MHIKAHNPAIQSGNLGFSPDAPQLRQKEAEALPTVGQQLADNLFTSGRPETLNADEYPELQAILVALEPAKRRLAVLAGDQDADYTLVLAQDGSAAIDERGLIFLGAGFLLQHRRDFDVLIGAIAHEIGHRPKRLKKLQRQQRYSPDELNALLVQEEILADRFAGLGLGELGLDCEPLIAYLVEANSPPHPAYLPVADRAVVIREAYQRGESRSTARKKLFPEFDRHTSAKNHIRDL